MKRIAGQIAMWISAAVVLVLACWTPVLGIRFDWTTEEHDCAKSIGVELWGETNTESSTYVKRLAWLADVVVYGDVLKVEHDVVGPYHTLVRVNASSVLKGQLAKSAITVMLYSGPVYAPSLDRIQEGHLAGEPSFAEGEKVLLFLTKGMIEAPPGDVRTYVLAQDQYSVVNSSKFLVDDGKLVESGRGSGTFELGEVNTAISETVSAQATNCHKEGE